MHVEIRHVDDKKGNGLFATKDFKAGAVVFEEEPLVCAQFAWNTAYGYKACDHCLRPLESAEDNVRRLTGKFEIILPYPECCTTNKSKITQCNLCGIEYCSAECQMKAFNQYHRSLCKGATTLDECHPLEMLNEAWKNIHYPPETSTIMIIPRIIATILQAPNRDVATSQFLRFCHRSINEDAELAHKFLGPKFVNQLSHIHTLLKQAVPNEGVEQLLTPMGFQSLVALIGTNGQGVGTSPISQWVTNSSEKALPQVEKAELDVLIDKLYEDMDAQSGNFLNNEGVALFSLQSACNHSCIPNTEPTYLHNNSTLSLIALKDIQAGDEIFISYLDECSLHRSRHSRQKELKEHYLFICDCDKCVLEINEPNLTSDEEDDDDEEMSE